MKLICICARSRASAMLICAGTRLLVDVKTASTKKLSSSARAHRLYYCKFEMASSSSEAENYCRTGIGPSAGMYFIYKISSMVCISTGLVNPCRL